MTSIVIKKSNDKWVAIHRGRKIGHSKCKACIINIIKSITRQAEYCDEIVVLEEDGSVGQTIKTGAKSGIHGRREDAQQAGE